MKSSLRLTGLYLIIAFIIAFTVAAGPEGSACPCPGTGTGTQDSLKQEIRQPVYTTSRLVTPKPVIDGKLDDECWKYGTWAGDYHQFVPHEGASPTWSTEMNIQYDDRNLYIAFRAWDGEPEKIVRMSGGRDETVGDMVGVTFDSYRDYRTGFEFTITAWGQKVDLVLFNPMDWDFNWNAVWKGKVEWRIQPGLLSLRFPSASSDTATRMNRYGECTHGDGYHVSRKKATGKYNQKRDRECCTTSVN